MTSEQLVESAKGDRHFLNNVLDSFPADGGDARPFPDMMTAGQQVAHIAMTIDWFRVGVFGDGFNWDFSEQEAGLKKSRTMAEARAELDAAWDRWEATMAAATPEVLASRFPEGHYFAGKTRENVAIYNSDHTAHHRGILTVYLRALGIVPPMVYG